MVRFNTHSWFLKSQKSRNKGTLPHLDKEHPQQTHRYPYTQWGKTTSFPSRSGTHALTALLQHRMTGCGQRGKRCTHQKGRRKLSYLQMTRLPTYKFPRILQKNSRTDKWVHLSVLDTKSTHKNQLYSYVLAMNTKIKNTLYNCF